MTNKRIIPYTPPQGMVIDKLVAKGWVVDNSPVWPKLSLDFGDRTCYISVAPDGRQVNHSIQKAKPCSKLN